MDGFSPRSGPAVDAPGRVRISVVVPSYNQAAFLPETLDSLLAQGASGVEIIVVDGESTDGSVERLEAYRPEIERRGGCVIVERDGGQSEAINKGLRRATGEVVGWLCSDDTLLPGALEAVRGAFGGAPGEAPDWVAGAVVMTDAAGTPQQTIEPRGDFTLTGVLVHRATAGFELPQPGVFWRRSLHEELGYLREDLHHCFDFEWWLRLIASGRSPRRVPVSLATYRLHEQSKTCSSSTGFLREHLRVEPPYARKLPWAARVRALRRLSYYRRFTALAEAQQRGGGVWPLVARRPWWLASQQVREALRDEHPRAAA